jgi:hypothetical protein
MNLRDAKNHLLLSFTLLYLQRQLLLSNHCICSILGFSGILPRRHSSGVLTSEDAFAVFLFYIICMEGKTGLERRIVGLEKLWKLIT